MKARSFLTAAVPALLLAAASARGEDLAGRLSIAVQAGTQSELSGELLKSTQGSLIGKPMVVNGRRYKDVYQPDLRLQASIGYGVSERFEVVARGSYYKADASGVEAGTFDGKSMFAFFAPKSADASRGVTGEKIAEYGAELALRYYLAPQSRLKSYVAPVLGLRYTDEMLVSFSIPDAGSAVLNVPFSQSGTVPVFGVDLGFGFDFSDHFFMGLDTGLRYQGGAKGFNQFPELGAMDGADPRWSAPVSVVVGLRF